MLNITQDLYTNFRLIARAQIQTQLRSSSASLNWFFKAKIGQLIEHQSRSIRDIHILKSYLPLIDG